MHVADGIDVDQKADPRDHHQHDQRQGVHQEGHLGLEGAGGDPGVQGYFHRFGGRRELQVLEEDGQGEGEAQTHHRRAQGPHRAFGQAVTHEAVDHKAHQGKNRN